ncbi:kelch domain-containing protein 10 [Folsomia candida]|nr:kelch domain-containing protein 10 [Folsomia candida]
MKRAKDRLLAKRCDRCRTNKLASQEKYAFKPFEFQELLVDCIKGLKPHHCIAPKVPDPRSGHRVVCDDGNMYSFGGYLETSINSNWPPHLAHGSQRLFQELWCYNFAEAQWIRLPTLGKAPKELASHSAVLHGNHLLVFGGTGVPFGGCSSNKMNICDLRSLEWKCLETTGQPPIPQYGQAVVLDRKNKDFYVIGGTTGYTYSMDIHKLNMNTLEWEKLFVSRGELDEPESRYRHEVAFDGEKIFILGGGTAAQAYNLKQVHAFDVKSKQWKALATKPYNNRYPAARKCQGSVQIGDNVIINGGYDSRTIFNDVWMLHLPTMKWTELIVTMPVPLYFHSTSVTNSGCMYMFGGVADMRLNTRTNQVFKIWLKIPKLKEICWEAVLHYNKKLRSMSHSELLKMGIPQEFVNLVHPAPPEGPSTSRHWISNLMQLPESGSGKMADMEIEPASVAIGY